MRTIEVTFPKEGPRGQDLTFDMDGDLVDRVWDGDAEYAADHVEDLAVVKYWIRIVGNDRLVKAVQDKRFSAELNGDDADDDCLHSETECDVCSDCGAIVEGATFGEYEGGGDR